MIPTDANCFNCDRPRQVAGKYGLYCSLQNEHCSMIDHQVRHENRSIQECWKPRRPERTVQNGKMHDEKQMELPL